MRLSTKVLLALAIVIAVALVTASLLIGRSANNAYRVYLRGYQQQQLVQLAEQAGDLFTSAGSWDEVQGWLNSEPAELVQSGGMGSTRGQGRGPRRQQQGQSGTIGTVLVVDADTGQPLAASVSADAVDGYLVAAPIVVNGETVAALATEPTLVGMGSAEETLLSQVNRAVLLSALAAGLVALLVGWLLVASILRPLRRLEAGVAQVASGDLEARVDVSGSDEIARLATSFNTMAANLQQQEALRQRLVADIAHELRTPLSVVQGNLQAILDGVFPLELDEIRTVQEEARLIARLVTDLHELAQAEAGRLPLVRQQVKVATVIQHMANSFRPLAAEKDITLITDLPAGSLTVDADPDRLHQILTNLLGNAIRHTPKDGEVRLAAVEQIDRVRFSVANSGQGIEPEDLPHIFDRFYRVDTSRERDDNFATNAGLGLAIVKALVEAHGGEIWVESTPGEVAKFTFELPNC
jgi:signal transduction histidine kinase